MIRISVNPANDARRQALVSRLRCAAIEAGPMLACDAAVFFGPPFDAIEPFLQAGKPVLVAAEWSPELLQRIATLPQAALVVVNPDRYLPSRLLIRQQLDAGKLGTPGLIRIHRWMPGEPSPVTGSLLRDLDLTLWYFGNAPNAVFATSHVRGTQIHLGFRSGGMALIDHASVPPGEAYYSLSLIASNGAAYADDHLNMQLGYRGGTPAAVRAPEAMQWSALIQEFADTVKTHQVSSSKFPHWRDSTAIGEAVEASLHAKKAIIPEGMM